MNLDLCGKYRFKQWNNLPSCSASPFGRAAYTAVWAFFYQPSKVIFQGQIYVRIYLILMCPIW